MVSQEQKRDDHYQAALLQPGDLILSLMLKLLRAKPHLAAA